MDSNNNAIDYGNLDSRITFELNRDFRIHKPKLDLPLQFEEWMWWRDDHIGVLETIEWAASILNDKDGISINAMIRIMKKFSGTRTEIQRQAINTLIGNCRFVRAEIKFKVSTDLKIDFDNSLLFIQSHKKNSNERITTCYG